ncbi:hypothetical protein [Microvirga tunisiensis]|uniref:Uncharacterized protein n=1 Tax=Microvirga tunisiensis TaxID=2108360 RepID=A0A5N7MPZ4_9HYPH|nr:hypothetical protein [Microvirga tunisiensis]MPR10941.1 hypothetical protein [Microvirga tunisiensis]MPR29092.1 hypothetical protein [Microvirga tunisiensis]
MDLKGKMEHRERRHDLACRKKVNLKSAAAHRIDALGDPVCGDAEAGVVLWSRGHHVPAEGLRGNDSEHRENGISSAKCRMT